MDKFKVVIKPTLDGEVPSEDDVLKAMEDAGWSDDPGTGKTILVPDERGMPGYEVINPVPFAPPIGWEPTPPIDELIRDRVHAEYQRLKDADEIDDIVDAEDFDIPDELPELSSIYEIIAMEDESPRIPKDAVADAKDRIKAELDYEELKERERLFRVRRSHEEYRRRQEEHEALYGPSAAVRDALERQEEKGG